MLEMVHRDHGKLPWAGLFAPAIRLARDGFPVSPRLHAMIAGDAHLKTFPETAAYFFHADGAPLQTGEILKNPALADAMQTVADGGARVFYVGPIARDIVAAVRDAASNPGQLRETDFTAYRAKRRDAVCGAYRTWRICGMPPPSSGGITLLEALGILESFDLAALAPLSPEAVHLMAEASRLAFADRNRYLGDPDFARAPAGLLLDPAYLARRARLVSPGSTMDRVFPGTLGAAAPASAGAADSPASSTTHISAVDDAGNAVAFTSSIEAEFGSRLMVHGFLLNNELTDFSFRPEIGGMPAANRVEAGKRPLSSMAPTLVFDADGRLALTVGSPGGQSIIGYVLKTLVAVLDWGLNIQEAIDLPNVLAKTGPVEIEKGTAADGLAAALEALGHAVDQRDLTSGLQGIAVTPRGLEGGADRRREGAALGG
jgi:gamma-glutamyltranspeptidase/glutathione hydrolase